MKHEQSPAIDRSKVALESGGSSEESTGPGSAALPGPAVVGIGASAGGLEAFKILLAHLPADTGFAFVLVQHLDPKHHSLLSEILGRSTHMPVRDAVNGTLVEANHVYVIAHNTELTIANRKLTVTPRRASAGQHMPIDRFLRSLAQDCGNRAIAVVLSGAGMDGSGGLQTVKEAGGITFAQSPETAEFSSMPKAAAAATVVDFVLSPEQIAAELGRIARHPFFIGNFSPDHAVDSPTTPADQFPAIFAIMQKATGIDFSLYSEKTVERRILRRLALRNIGSIEGYARELERDPAERSALQRDLLISVTSFFRDADSFEALKREVFPLLIKDRLDDTTIRIWVPGCATGEEAYSIAILLLEYLNEAGEVFPIQIFASDINQTAIESARLGKYPEKISAEITPERLDRYFSKIDTGYLVNKALREICIFSRHNLIDDPPFSKLDLISCRNVLIYLRTVQKNIIPLFHYALKPNGFLLLGRSETAAFVDLFTVLDSDHRIYARKGTTRKLHQLYPRAVSFPAASIRNKVEFAPVSELWDGVDVGKEVDRLLLSKYSPDGVVVDDDLNVIEIRGQAAPYFKLPVGKLTFRLLTLIPDTGFFLQLEKLLLQVRQTGIAARKDRLQYDHDGVISEVNVEVTLLEGRRRRAFLVIFDSGRAEGTPHSDGDAQIAPHERQIAKLKEELEDARQRLLAITDEHQTSQDESQNATEEVLSTNEELQSLNEELETAKEELQSSNEELVTVNLELQSRNKDLAQASHVTLSIVETVREPLVVLDTGFRVTSANQAFYRAFRLLPKETEGQSLYALSGGSWDVPALRERLDRVLPGNSSFQDLELEKSFPALGTRSLVLSGCRLDALEMILLAIDDVTERKAAEKALRRSEEHLRQAQKMEAIGRLAGGIAHDFNNLLTAIVGYSGMLLESTQNEESVRQLEQIKNAGDRAAALTHQLLAFSRRQVLQPKILDLNSIVSDLDRMLRRLVGERIFVVLEVAAGLWRVKADPGEIGRALMNLCLNARDAMPVGGRLTIRTANVDAQSEVADPTLPPGNYVLLAVMDTGVGITSEVKEHIFEPFFTTKDVGKGTGLGLATVLGIVEQSGGTIRCDSEPGLGTTFTVLLPALPLGAETVPQARSSLADSPRGAAEVILLVEDEEIVRSLTRTILEISGYVVLEACDGEDALSVCRTHPGPIDLLLSDVMMPGIGGRELADQVSRLRPATKVLFMSGHTQDVVLKEGVGQSLPFLQKPFLPADLAHKVREVLDSGRR